MVTSQRKLKDLVSKYDEVFKDRLGKDDYMNMRKMDIALRPDAEPPRQHTVCKKVPVHWKAASDLMIKQILEDRVIKRMNTLCTYLSAVKWVCKPGVTEVQGLKI